MEKFSFIKQKSISFLPFELSDFNLKTGETVTLKNGKKLTAEKFLNEVNFLEENLNQWGYTLRD